MAIELPTVATVGVDVRDVPRLKSMSPNCEWRHTTVPLQVLPAKVPSPVSESAKSPSNEFPYMKLVPVVETLSRSMLWMPLMSAGMVSWTPGTGIPPVAVDVKVPITMPCEIGDTPAPFHTTL